MGGEKRAFSKRKWPKTSRVLSPQAVCQEQPRISARASAEVLEWRWTFCQPGPAASPAPGPQEIPALATACRAEGWSKVTCRHQKSPGLGDRREHSLCDWTSACLRFKERLKMSSGGHGSWYTAWSPRGEPVCPNADSGLGIQMYKKRLSPKGKVQNNFSLWRERKEGGRERRSFLFQRLFKELICDTCTHFLTTGQNKEVDVVKKDLYQAQAIASQAGSPATKAILRTAVGISCTWSPVLQQAMHKHFISFVPFHSLLWCQR